MCHRLHVCHTLFVLAVGLVPRCPSYLLFCTAEPFAEEMILGPRGQPEHRVLSVLCAHCKRSFKEEGSADLPLGDRGVLGVIISDKTEADSDWGHNFHK